MRGATPCRGHAGAAPARSDHVHQPATNTPPGWSYNPSEWANRAPIIVLAAVATAVAAYMAAYQVRLIDDVWEPFFGDGSRRILDSPVSHVLIIPDAALGGMAYLADVILGVIGGRDRWRRMPWVVLAFGIAIGPVGAVGVLLVIIQPVVYDTFCTLCLVTAVISVAMIGPAMDEVLATLQHLKRERRQGRSWRDALLGRGAS
jgi:uncharacterized membrane protein